MLKITMQIWIWTSEQESVDDRELLQKPIRYQLLLSLFINRIIDLEERQSTKSHPGVAKARNDKIYKENYK